MFTNYPGDDLLGYTYDVFGLYADEQSRIRHVVADAAQTTTARVHERTYDVPSNVSVVPYDHSEVVLARGESYTAFSKSLEAKLKLRVFAPGFFASTKNRFAADVRGSQHSLYAHLMDLTYAAMVSLQSGQFALKSDFADALDNPVLPAKSLFRDYGTHLVTGMLVGGCVRYLAHAQQDSDYRMTEFETDVRARYKLLSGSVNVEGSRTHAVHRVSDVGQLQIVGGSQEARARLVTAQDFAGWVGSVAAQPEFVDFAHDGLLPIWELCRNPMRAADLKAEFSRLFTPRRGTTSWTSHLGSSHELQLSSDHPEEIATGFGGRIRDNNFVCLAVQLENVRTGERAWRYASGEHSWELSYSVPPGCAMTGLAMRASDSNLSNLRVYYQCLRLGSAAASNSCLDGTVFHHDVPAAYSGWEADTRTSSGNRQVVVGVSAKCSDSNISGLATQTCTLTLPFHE